MTFNNSEAIRHWEVLCLPEYTGKMTTVFSFQEKAYTEYVQLCAIIRRFFCFQMMEYEKILTFIQINTGGSHFI